MTLSPVFGEPLEPTHPSADSRKALLLRRSTQADMLDGGAGPDDAQLREILAIAARVPDHRRVVPFRFVVFQSDSRARAGAILKAVFANNNPDATPEALEREARRFMRAPVVIGVVSKVDHDHRTPEWEQILTAGAVCQNMLLGASALGFAAQWLTEWYAYDDAVLEKFGLSSQEKIAGYVYIGQASDHPKERRRPELDDLISEALL